MKLKAINNLMNSKDGESIMKKIIIAIIFVIFFEEIGWKMREKGLVFVILFISFIFIKLSNY